MIASRSLRIAQHLIHQIFNSGIGHPVQDIQAFWWRYSLYSYFYMQSLHRILSGILYLSRSLYNSSVLSDAILFTLHFLKPVLLFDIRIFFSVKLRS